MPKRSCSKKERRPGSDAIRSDRIMVEVTTRWQNVTDNSLDVRAVEFSGLASRIRRLDASFLLWLALISVLAFLILNPVLRLIISSLQETDTGSFTLANYRTAYGNVRHLQSLL